MDYTDGNTDTERLHELLSFGTEREEVDYKRRLDLGSSSKKDNLSFVKDCMAFMNRPGGGYLVVGVDDTGQVDPDDPGITQEHFESSTLQEKVQAYVDAQVRINSTVHTVAGRLVALIYIYHSPLGLPVPAAKNGSYTDQKSGKTVFVFREGEIVVRQGTGNVALKFAHWSTLLASYREQMRDEARAEIDRLVHSLNDLLGQLQVGDQSPPLLSLEPALDHEDFARTVQAHMDQGKTQPLSRAARDLMASVGRPARPQTDELTNRLDKTAIVGVEAVRAGDRQLYQEVVGAFSRCFDSYVDFAGDSAVPAADGVHLAAVYLEFLKRLYALGSAAARERRWWALEPIVAKSVTVQESNYTYGTWLRFGQVMAARAGLLQSKDETPGGQLITQSLQLLLTVPQLRPGLPDAAPEEVSQRDGIRQLLLDSLCSFDLWQCVGASIRRAGESGSTFYPSFASFRQQRTEPSLRVLVTDAEARREAFHGADDQVVREHLLDVVGTAERQSLNSGSVDWGLISSRMTRELIDRHLPGG